MLNAQAERAAAHSTGPAKGTLMLVGGGADSDIFLKEFAHLVGGLDQPIVIIPTAADDEQLSTSEKLEMSAQWFRDYGFSNVKLLHTRSPQEANTAAFVQPITTAKGVWIAGGRQWRLMDAYAGTRTLTELQAVLARGGVIAGTSAGATIQGSFLARGDTKTNTIMSGDHQDGFGFISNVAIDQHLLQRNRQFDLFEILDQHPEMLGIGLDENTGIVVRGNRFEVIGKSYVAIYDGTMWSEDLNESRVLEASEKKFYLLKAGQIYDLHKRGIVGINFLRSVNVPAEQLQQFTGTYQAEGGYTLTITLDNSLLQVKTSWSNDIHPFLCERKDAFFDRDWNIRLVGDFDKTGNLIGLNSYGRFFTYWTKD